MSSKDTKAAVRKFKEKPAPVIRKTTPLKEWMFHHDPDDQGKKKGFFSYLYNDADWETVLLPHSTRHVPESPIRYGKDIYEFFQSGEESTVWYATTDNWYRA